MHYELHIARVYCKNYVANDGKWHHVVVTWNDKYSKVSVYIDGKLKPIYYHNQNKAGVITGKGALVIGQEQDAYLERFDARQCFQGNLTSFNMWDRVLTSDEISEHAKRYPSGEGNLIKWVDLVPLKSESVKYSC
ncbi:hypothetical protein QZH41_001877 [Actinostola sp. cb2023]|nr:hypothetical protein QZH41_001877 [Actinostola sp. cb2023]